MHSEHLPEFLLPIESSRRAILLYEDIGTIDQGLSFAKILNSELGIDAGGLEYPFWLGMLDVPSEAAELLRCAKGGPYVVLSLRGDVALSPASREWLWDWLGHAPGDSAALIVLFDPKYRETGEATAIRRELEHMAAVADVGIFVFDTEPGERETAAPELINMIEEEQVAEWFIGAMDAFSDSHHCLAGAA